MALKNDYEGLDSLADGTESDDGNGTTHQLGRLEVAPLPTLLTLTGDAEVAGVLEDVGDDLLSDVRSVDARGVGYGDVVRGQFLEREMFVTGRHPGE